MLLNIICCFYLLQLMVLQYMLLQRVVQMEQLHWNDRLTHDLLTYLVNVYHIQSAYSAIHTQDNKFVKFD